jgi:hypothetical protein
MVDGGFGPWFPHRVLLRANKRRRRGQDRSDGAVPPPDGVGGAGPERRWPGDQLDLRFAAVPRLRQQCKVVLLGQRRPQQPHRCQVDGPVGQAVEDDWEPPETSRTASVTGDAMPVERSKKMHFGGLIGLRAPAVPERV